jgi:hypothetical protein
MAYADAIESDSADSGVDETALLAGDADAEPSEIDLQATELPVFLTEDEPAGVFPSTGLRPAP